VHPYGDPYTVPGLIDTCRAQLAAHGCPQPIIASEHSGPLPTDFPANFPFLRDVLATHQRQFLGEQPMPDTIEDVLASTDSAVVDLYRRIEDLPQTLQMFMPGCPSEAENQRHLLARRDLVARHVLALAAGLPRTMHYPILPEFPLRQPLPIAGVLMFDKLKLVESDGTTIARRYPAADAFALLARHLDGADRVEQLEVPHRTDIFLFQIRRPDEAPRLIAWQRRPAAEQQDPPPFDLSC